MKQPMPQKGKTRKRRREAAKRLQKEVPAAAKTPRQLPPRTRPICNPSRSLVEYISMTPAFFWFTLHLQLSHSGLNLGNRDDGDERQRGEADRVWTASR